MSRFGRFVVGGTVNTAACHGLFLVLSWSVPVAVAYSIAYFTGIALAYLINTTFVFRTRVTLASAVRFPGVYLVAYPVGLVVLTLLTGAGVPKWLAMPVVIAVNVPVTFALTRWVMTGGARHREPASRPEGAVGAYERSGIR
ncbi:GtrA family protein [Sphaerisporangium fuscum]|uniref:GtrA family protein n=1 Tax=Sphaerisporangium fuscum TaxID=2835868 RepID=UPI001BDD6D62|nr:GtrA family protein [Sphaerisporangium fuscum]